MTTHREPHQAELDLLLGQWKARLAHEAIVASLGGDDTLENDTGYLFEAPMPDAPFCYAARDIDPSPRTGQNPQRLICAECVQDVPEEGYVYLEHWLPDPQPMSQSDAYGWTEGRRVTCYCCSKEIG